MLPFNEILRLWRLERQLTQEQLARRARIPRPNLSAMERGHREVSLSTLRALAAALHLRPGVLVDGLAPGEEAGPLLLSREAMERIADAVVHNRAVQGPTEQVLVNWLRQVVTPRTLAAQHRRTRSCRGGRASAAAWMSLRARCAPEALRSLVQRIDDRQQRA